MNFYSFTETEKGRCFKRWRFEKKLVLRNGKKDGMKEN